MSLWDQARPAMQVDGIKHVCAYNDSKLHEKKVKEAWAQYGIKLHPAAGKNSWDRDVGGFPVDWPLFITLDKTVHHKWKYTRNGGLYAIWNAREPTRKTTGGFYNNVINLWTSIPQNGYHNASKDSGNYTRHVVKRKEKFEQEFSNYTYNQVLVELVQKYESAERCKLSAK